MGRTLIEKIFSYKLKKDVKANGEYLVPVDVSIGTDGTAPLAIEQFLEMGRERVVFPERIILVADHFSPSKDIASAKLENRMKAFAIQQGIKHYYPNAEGNGICHVLIPEKRLIRPYEIIVGADSHTCTYGGLGAFAAGIGSTDLACVWAINKVWMKVPRTIRIELYGVCRQDVYAKDVILYVLGRIGKECLPNCCIEFVGEGISNLSISDRLTMCNMVAEMGAVTGIMEVDETVIQYYKDYGIHIKNLNLKSDEDAEFKSVISIDLSVVEPMVAVPYSPFNVFKVSELKEICIDQVVIGSCTNGRIEDFRVAHSYLKGKRISDKVKLLIIPGSQQVLEEMVQEDLLLDFIHSGAIVCPPTCGPCVGAHMGVLADGKVGVYTTNRNYLARNGESNTKVYLASPAIAALSALNGKLRNFML